MNNLQLYYKINSLPNSLKAEVLKYMDKLLSQKKALQKKNKQHPKAGCMKGTFEIKEGFDEPLEDFREYME